MLALFRHSTRQVVAALAAGLLLRLWFIHYCPVIDGDTLVYGEIARNWFWHGVYGFTRPSGIDPTLIRLPGYPLFLGLCSVFFGIDHYSKILLIQAVFDLCSCLLVAGFAARMISHRAGMATLFLAALCPFTANFVASPLTETLTLFCISLGLYALAQYVDHPKLGVWFWLLALSISYAALLRPDGALLGLVLVPAMFWHGRQHISTSRGVMLAAFCILLALMPFVGWTVRNLRTMHVFQPLAPRYANDPGEYVPHGWNRWIKSWAVDFTSTSEIYWNVNGALIDVRSLPARAFDTPGEKVGTSALFAAYNTNKIMTPELNRRFGLLAQQRIQRHPFRYYVELPLLRLANMLFRPRVGQLRIHLRWWQYQHHPAETIFCLGYAALNLLYLLLAASGLRKKVPFTAVMASYVILRCLLLLTLETPESRYTLECFPMIFILAGAALTIPKTTASATSSQQPVSSHLS